VSLSTVLVVMQPDKTVAGLLAATLVALLGASIHVSSSSNGAHMRPAAVSVCCASWTVRRVFGWWLSKGGPGSCCLCVADRLHAVAAAAHRSACLPKKRHMWQQQGECAHGLASVSHLMLRSKLEHVLHFILHHTRVSAVCGCAATVSLHLTKQGRAVAVMAGSSPETAAPVPDDRNWGGCHRCSPGCAGWPAPMEAAAGPASPCGAAAVPGHFPGVRCCCMQITAGSAHMQMVAPGVAACKPYSMRLPVLPC
jgi:hypothetical protein